jgi:hypothetical protein
VFVRLDEFDFEEFLQHAVLALERLDPFRLLELLADKLSRAVNAALLCTNLDQLGTFKARSVIPGSLGKPLHQAASRMSQLRKSSSAASQFHSVRLPRLGELVAERRRRWQRHPSSGARVRDMKHRLPRYGTVLNALVRSVRPHRS